MSPEEYLNDLVLRQEEVIRAEGKLDDLRAERDMMIYGANEKHGIPLLQIARAIGLRRDTVLLAKMRGELNIKRDEREAEIRARMEASDE